MEQNGIKEIIRFGERVPKSEQYATGWREIYQFHTGEVSKADILGHKSIICLPGDGSISAQALSGTCKYIQNMLLNAGMAEQDMPRIYSVGFDTYTAAHRLKVFQNTHDVQFGQNLDVSHIPLEEQTYWKSFFNNYLKPLIATADNKPLPEDIVRQNLQNITFVTHCHGGVFAYDMERLLSEQMKNLYHDKTPDLMKHLRMLHFSSRRPLTQTNARHFHIISKNDPNYCDLFLNYSHLHKAIRRIPLKEPQALLPLSDTQEILLMRQLTANSLDNDHEVPLYIFSGSSVFSQAPENEAAVNLVQRVLKHFITRPDDMRPIREIVSEINPDFVETAERIGRHIMHQRNEELKKDQGLLSLLARPGVHIAKPFPETKMAYLSQPMEDGQILYEQQLNLFRKTGDNQNLINLLSQHNALARPILFQGLQTAILAKDWKLMQAYTAKIYRFQPQELKKILKDCITSDLPHLLPILRKTLLHKDLALIEQLKEQAQKIPNSSGRVRVQNYLATAHLQLLKEKPLRLLGPDHS